MSTVGNFRRRYQAEGVLGLADRRPVRKKPKFAVVAAMRQAITEEEDDSTCTGAPATFPGAGGAHVGHRGAALAASKLPGGVRRLREMYRIACRSRAHPPEDLPQVDARPRSRM